MLTCVNIVRSKIVVMYYKHEKSKSKFNRGPRTVLVKGKQTCHSKVSTKHPLNKVGDTKFVLVIPVVHPHLYML